MATIKPRELDRLVAAGRRMYERGLATGALGASGVRLAGGGIAVTAGGTRLGFIRKPDLLFMNGAGPTARGRAAACLQGRDVGVAEHEALVAHGDGGDAGPRTGRGRAATGSPPRGCSKPPSPPCASGCAVISSKVRAVRSSFPAPLIISPARLLPTSSNRSSLCVSNCSPSARAA